MPLWGHDREHPGANFGTPLWEPQIIAPAHMLLPVRRQGRSLTSLYHVFLHPLQLLPDKGKRCVPFIVVWGRIALHVNVEAWVLKDLRQACQTFASVIIFCREGHSIQA